MTGKMAFSKAGHDKGKLYLIIKQEEDRVWLADGAGRGLLTPKKKNKKHVQIENQGVDEKELERFWENPAWADNQIRETLSQFYQRMDSE